MVGPGKGLARLPFEEVRLFDGAACSKVVHPFCACDGEEVGGISVSVSITT